MKHPLTKRQKAVLSQLSTRAWNWCGREMGYETPEDYRHAAVAQVTGGVAGGLRGCTQEHYVPLYNYFAAVVGANPIADRTPRSDLARELYLLRDEISRHGLTDAYAETIMRARLGVTGGTLDSLAHQLGPEGVRQVKFTIINRGRAKTRRLEKLHHLDPVTEPHTSSHTLPPPRLAEHFKARLI